MALDTYDSILGLILQATGNNNNQWGQIANNSDFIPIARAIAGVNTHGDTSGTVDMSTVTPPAGLRQDIDYMQVFNGTLTGDLTVIVPNVSKRTRFWNKTGGNFNLYVKVPGGVAASGPSSPGGLVQIPQGAAVDVLCDGAGTLVREDDRTIGTFSYSAKAAIGAGELACNGASVLKATYPDLYAKIGTTYGSADSLHFTLPNLTDTNRFLRAAGGSLAVGTYHSNQNQAHTHTFSGSLSAGTLGTDTQGNHSHTINISDPGHQHGVQIPQNNSTTGGGTFPISGPLVNLQTNASYTGISASSVAAGAHQHNITGIPGLGTLATVSQGGTEARPEAMACTIAIRY